MNRNSVQFRIDLQANPAAAKRLEEALRRVGNEGKKAGKDINNSFAGLNRRLDFGGLQGLLGGAAVLGGIRAVVAATVEQEKALAQLDARLRSTAGAAGMSREELVNLAGAMQQVTTFGDDAVVEAEAMLLTFTKVGRDVFPRALEAILDVSTGMGTDLQSAAVQVGKALNDPIKGVTALGRAGVQFSADQKETIKTLVETGRVTEAQTVVLKELEVQFGGSARAARETLGGALEALKNSFGDLLEGNGDTGVRGATEAINELTETINRPEVKEGFQNMVNGIFTTIQWLTQLSAKVASVTKFIGESIAARVYGPAIGDIPRLEDAIKKQQAVVKKLTTPFATESVISRAFAPSKEKIAEERAKLAQLQEMLKLSYELAAQPKPTPSPTAGGNAPRVPSIDLPEDDGSKGKSKKAGKPELTEEEKAWKEWQEEMADIEQAWADIRAGHEMEAIQRQQEKQDAIDGVRAALEEERAVLAMTAEQQEIYNNLKWAGVEAGSEAGKQIIAETEALQRQREALGEQIEVMDSVRAAGKDLFVDLAKGENPLQSVEEALDRLRDRLLDMAAENLMDMVFGKSGEAGGRTWGGFLSSIMGGLFGGANAKGNIFGQGAVKAFANGGVVTGPITFPMARGQFGLMGEDGAEAIMPLRRTRSGRLGVEMAGGGRQGPVVNQSIVVQQPVTRRTAAQIALETARAQQRVMRRGG